MTACTCTTFGRCAACQPQRDAEHARTLAKISAGPDVSGSARTGRRARRPAQSPSRQPNDLSSGVSTADVAIPWVAAAEGPAEKPESA